MAEWSRQSFSSPGILVHAEGCRVEACHWLLFLYLYSVYTNKKISHPSSLSYVCAVGWIKFSDFYYIALFIRAGNSLICSSLIRSFRSNQMSDCEQFAQIAQYKWATVSKLLRSLRGNEHREQIAQIAQRKWATVSKLLRSLKTNERTWAIRSGRLEETSQWAICSKKSG